MLRTLAVMAVAASSCSDCLGPELTVPPEAGGASGGAGAPADECFARAPASDFAELTIDFETMMAPRDRFGLGESSGGIALSGSVASQSQVFIRQGHDQLSKRSLLLLLGEQDWGTVGLQWGVCLDATSRSGITFWAKGEASSASVQPSFAGTLPDIACAHPAADIPLTTEWQMYSYVWSDFCPQSPASLTFASKVTGLTFWIQETQTEPWIALDDVSFSGGGG